ncbi:MAG: hypothetical protein OSJ55_08630 [Bacteroidales bacterium]|nr:hypothetical protein [Bacteroidales bacterium]
MNRVYLTLILMTAAFFAGPVLCPAYAQEQNKEPDIMELAENEADRLQRLLDLDDWQTFYVDSTLKHDYPAMREELDNLSKAKVSNVSIYVAVQDKWMEAIDKSYRTIFDDRQWAAYLKSGAAKQQKARAKRKEKAEGKKSK